MSRCRRASWLDLRGGLGRFIEGAVTTGRVVGWTEGILGLIARPVRGLQVILAAYIDIF